MAAIRPAVVLEAGDRPEAATRVQLDAFEGPLALLLALIEARRLDVLTVPLGDLADAYLDALAGLGSDRLPSVSAFVSIASQLILIKSRAILPRRDAPVPGRIEDEGADPEAELRARLLVYRAHRDAGTRLQQAALRLVGLFRRDPSAAQTAGFAGARLAEMSPIDPAVLVSALNGLVQIAPPPELPAEVMTRTITLTERVGVIRAALRDADSVVLQDLLRGVRDRVVVAVTFLALLELVKRREAIVEQARPWGPILVRPTTDAERGGIAAQPAEGLDESLESFA